MIQQKENSNFAPKFNCKELNANVKNSDSMHENLDLSYQTYDNRVYPKFLNSKWNYLINRSFNSRNQGEIVN